MTTLNNHTQSVMDELKMLNPTKKDWIAFMQLMHGLCPFLVNKSRGAPTANDLQNSIIGQMGEPTLKAFLANQLGISHNTWKVLQKAYKHVQNHEYLAELKPAPSAINSVSSLPSDFPATHEAWNVAIESVRTQRKSIKNKPECIEAKQAIRDESGQKVRNILNVQGEQTVRSSDQLKLQAFEEDLRHKKQSDHMRVVTVGLLTTLESKHKRILLKLKDEMKSSASAKSMEMIDYLIRHCDFIIRSTESKLSEDIDKAA